MAKSKNKFYVVWEGFERGIFTSWDDCKKRIEGYQGAKYKGFETLSEAKLAFSRTYIDYYGKTEPTAKQVVLKQKVGKPIIPSISVDAACSGNPGALEYRGVYTQTGKEIFRQGPFPLGTVNIGEFLAIVHALAWMKQNNLDLPLYSDSVNGMLWVKLKRVNTKLERNAKNEQLFQLIERALVWLHNNSYSTKILKWETEAWGEIPADFGRK